MALTPSNMLPLGTQAPDFKLLDSVSGGQLSLNDVKGKKGLVVMFICNHCPFVKHINGELTKLANEYMMRDIGFVAISSNDIANYPEDAPDKMSEEAQKQQYPFPYLFDATQEVAKAYHAACTPDFYLFDEKLECVYRGQLDDSRPGNNIPVTGEDLRNALNRLLNSEDVVSDQKPSQGCNIKWISP